MPPVVKVPPIPVESPAEIKLGTNNLLPLTPSLILSLMVKRLRAIAGVAINASPSTAKPNTINLPCFAIAYTFRDCPPSPHGKRFCLLCFRIRDHPLSCDKIAGPRPRLKPGLKKKILRFTTDQYRNYPFATIRGVNTDARARSTSTRPDARRRWHPPGCRRR